MINERFTLFIFSLITINIKIKLPHKVDEERGKAQFDKSKKVLIVTLPILKPVENLLVQAQQQNLVEECPQVNTDQTLHEDTKQPGTDSMAVTKDVEAQDALCTEDIPSGSDNMVNGDNGDEISEETECFDSTNASSGFI